MTFKCPVQLAAQVYQDEPCARSFQEDLEAHLLHGYVYSNHDVFLLARPVWSKAPTENIVNPWFNTFSHIDAWHVYLVAGDMMAPFRVAPYRLPFVTFEKRNKIRKYQWSEIKYHVARRWMPPYPKNA
jgi:hypothetical protein